MEAARGRLGAQRLPRLPQADEEVPDRPRLRQILLAGNRHEDRGVLLRLHLDNKARDSLVELSRRRFEADDRSTDDAVETLVGEGQSVIESFRLDPAAPLAGMAAKLKNVGEIGGEAEGDFD